MNIIKKIKLYNQPHNESGKSTDCKQGKAIIPFDCHYIIQPTRLLIIFSMILNVKI